MWRLPWLIFLHWKWRLPWLSQSGSHHLVSELQLLIQVLSYPIVFLCNLSRFVFCPCSVICILVCVLFCSCLHLVSYLFASCCFLVFVLALLFVFLFTSCCVLVCVFVSFLFLSHFCSCSCFLFLSDFVYKKNSF